MAKNKGMKTYVGSEIGNIMIGQTGFDKLDGTTISQYFIANADHPDPDNPVAGDHYFPKVDAWVMVKLYRTTGSAAQSITVTTPEGDVTLANLPEGEAIVGHFTKIINNTATSYMLAYRG